MSCIPTRLGGLGGAKSSLLHTCALVQVLVQGLLLQLWAPLQSVGGTYRRLKKALVNLEDYVTLLRNPATPPDGSLPLPSVWRPRDDMSPLPRQHDSSATSASTSASVAASSPRNPAATQTALPEATDAHDHEGNGKPAMAAPVPTLSRSHNLAATESRSKGATVTQPEETATAALPSDESGPRQPLPRGSPERQNSKSGKTAPATGKLGDDVAHRKARGKRHTRLSDSANVADGSVISESTDGSTVSDRLEGFTLPESADRSTLSDTPEDITLSESAEGSALSGSIDGRSILDSADSNTLSDSPEGVTLSERAEGTALSDSTYGSTLSDAAQDITLAGSAEGTAPSDGTDSSAEGSGSMGSVGSRHSTAALTRPGAAANTGAADSKSTADHSVSSEGDDSMTTGNVTDSSMTAGSITASNMTDSDLTDRQTDSSVPAGGMTDSSVTAGIRGLHVQFQDVTFGYESSPAEHTQEADEKLRELELPRSEAEGQLIHGLSFEVLPGECIGIVGPPGRVHPLPP